MILPDWETATAKLEAGTADPLDKFVADWEPCDDSTSIAEAQFRADLQALVDYLTKQH